MGKIVQISISNVSKSKFCSSYWDQPVKNLPLRALFLLILPSFITYMKEKSTINFTFNAETIQLTIDSCYNNIGFATSSQIALETIQLQVFAILNHTILVSIKLPNWPLKY